MKEKLIERLNRKMENLTTTSMVDLLNYRYGELKGIIDTMREFNMLKSNEYLSLLKLVDYIYSEQMKKEFM